MGTANHGATPKVHLTLYAQELGKPTYGYEEGIIKFQPAIRKKENPGLGSGWDWAADDGTQGYDSPSTTCNAG